LHSTQEFGSFVALQGKCSSTSAPMWCRVWAECGCIIYVTDELPKSWDKGQSHCVIFYYSFYFVGYWVTCNIFLVACIMYSVTCNILLFASIMYFLKFQIRIIYFLDALYLILKFHPWKLGHSSIKCHP
jgi:hypothetical protein